MHCGNQEAEVPSLHQSKGMPAGWPTLARFLRGWGCSTPAIRGCIFKSYACLFLLRAKESHLIACTRCGRTATEAVGIVVGIGVRVVTLGVNQIGVVRGSRRTRPADI